MEDTDNYKILDTIIGSGATGTVYLGKKIKTNELVAVKKIDLGNKNIHIEHLMNEIDISSKIDHVNIVKFESIVRKPSCVYIVMEYCNYGTLLDVVNYNKKILDFKNDSDSHFELEKNTHYYLSQLKQALYYIQKIGYIHRDIKLENVLLIKNEVESIEEISGSCDKKEKNYHVDQGIIVKLADFGLSKQTNDVGFVNKTICGTPFYMAPEILAGNNYGSGVDLWSFGVIMYIMLFHSYPVEGTTRAQLQMKMEKLNINFKLNNNFSQKCYDLIIKLLNKDNGLRISWEYFFDHDWFSYWDNPQNNVQSDPISIPKITLSSQKPSNLSKMKLNVTNNKQIKYSYEEIRSKRTSGQISNVTSISNASSSDSLLGSDIFKTITIQKSGIIRSSSTSSASSSHDDGKR